ncbi:unnamed protein product [Brachionus calyciflorus]|uniref:Uncharacterized protein n=1 Tax=Brachionus calyciflorus TaxID=104777 RepID=A0A814LRP9_9BILA|nr:unnamed protein product [Brachionus calyciflorus]
MTERNFKRNKILNILKDAGLSTTGHGLPNILRSNRMSLKIFWTICVFVSLGICAFLLQRSFVDFLNWDVVTKIQLITETPAIFPTISICNANPIQTNYTVELANTVLTELNFSDPLNSPIFSFLTNSMKTHLTKYILFANFQKLNSTEKEKIGFLTPDNIIGCTYSGIPCNLSTHFESYYDNFHGSCLRFNSGKKSPLLNSSKPGLLNGLFLELFVGEPNDHSLTYSTGLYVMVHNSSSQVFYPKGYTVPTGKQVDIGIQKEYITKKPSPYSNCIDDKNELEKYEFYRIIDASGRKYKRELCYELCYQEKCLSKCQCQDFTHFLFPNRTICMNLKEFLCNYRAFAEFYASNVNELCSAKCPMECDDINYPLTFSSLEYPTKPYSKVLLKNPQVISKFKNISEVSYERLKSNVVLLYFYYIDSQYTKIEEVEKMNWLDFIAGIGGTLGLFIGISFLSLIEIVEVLIEVAYVFFESRVNKIMVKPKNSIEKS